MSADDQPKGMFDKPISQITWKEWAGLLIGVAILFAGVYTAEAVKSLHLPWFAYLLLVPLGIGAAAIAWLLFAMATQVLKIVHWGVPCFLVVAVLASKAADSAVVGVTFSLGATLILVAAHASTRTLISWIAANWPQRISKPRVAIMASAIAVAIVVGYLLLAALVAITH